MAKSYRGFLTRFDLFLCERGLTPDAVHPADIEAFAEWVKDRYRLSDQMTRAAKAIASTWGRAGSF